jgi:hypothetical protein
MTTKISWRDVPVTNRSGAVTGEDRLALLRSYRDSGVMGEAWPVTQDAFDGPWDDDGPKASGPAPEQIDWEGLDGELALGLLRARHETNGWAEWTEIAELAGLESDLDGPAHVPGLSEALEVAALRDGPARRLLGELHAAGVRYDDRRHQGDAARFYAPEAAPRGWAVPRPWIGPSWA